MDAGWRVTISGPFYARPKKIIGCPKLSKIYNIGIILKGILWGTQQMGI